MYKDFARRIQRDLARMVTTRQKRSVQSASVDTATSAVEVVVVSHNCQRFAVWFGGSMLASTPEFYKSCHTKQQYDEVGPSICRFNPVFGQ